VGLGGAMRPVIDTVYPFDQLAAAKAHMESNTQLGKIVLAGSPD
jgi:NADPH2:quinone reductase